MYGHAITFAETYVNYLKQQAHHLCWALIAALNFILLWVAALPIPSQKPLVQSNGFCMHINNSYHD